MATYTYEQLKVMTVADLRQIADGIQDPALEGHSTMHKDHLLPLLCKVLKIPTHHAAVGAEKTTLKAGIRQLKARRDEVIASGDRAKAAFLRRQIHSRKRRLRRLADELA